MDAWIERLKAQLSDAELFRIAQFVHHAYNPFALDDELWCLLRKTLPDNVLTAIPSHLLEHDVINALVKSQKDSVRKSRNRQV